MNAERRLEPALRFIAHRSSFIVLLVALALPAFAWGEKGHYIVNEAATLNLPTDMPHFFYKAFPELIWLGYEPDRWKSGGVSVDQATSPDHFLDYEYVSHLKLPNDRFKYIALLYSSDTLRRKGLDVSDPGFAPWRIAEVAQQLQVAFRNWRFSQPGTSERENLERDIIHYAGELGHYVADSANPHHATINYNGWVMPNPNGYANDCGTHSRFESQFVSHAVNVKMVTPKVSKTPKLREDYFAAGLESIVASNALTEKLYQLDRDGAFDMLRRPASPAGIEFASDRMAAGASLLRDLWWSAWVNSGKSTRRGSSAD
jgi:hypothetical protein